MTSKSTNLFFVIFLTLIALFIRLLPVLTNSFPLNDGGLFYSMIRDLQENRFALPFFTSYNQAQLPYAYPPLSFYIAGLISSIFLITPLDLIRFLPPIISVFSIPIFYLLAKRLTDDPLHALFGVMLFSFTPMAFEWQVMGGGLTRSLGQIFAILTFICAYEYYKQPTLSKSILLAVTGTLVTLTHPEAAMQTAIGVFVFAIMVGRSRKFIIPTILIGVGVLLLTSPWWGTLLARFGLKPFLAALEAAQQANGPFLMRLILLFQFNITEEPFVTFTACLGLVGTFLAISRRDYFLTVWMLSALLIDPRGGTRFAMLPLTLLGGLTLSAIWKHLDPNLLDENFDKMLLGSPAKRMFFGYLFISLLLGAFITMQNIQSRQMVATDDLAAIEWVQKNTSPNSTLITVTGAQPLLDPFTEWLPALSERRVATSIFGREWLNDGQFGAQAQAYQDLQTCMYKDAKCIQDWMNNNQAVDYLILAPTANQANGVPLQVWLINNKDFKLVYQNNNVNIYEVLK